MQGQAHIEMRVAILLVVRRPARNKGNHYIRMISLWSDVRRRIMLTDNEFS
jgi:hypothetical protein